MTSRTFPTLLLYLETLGIASRRDMRGCSPTEIAALEERYKLKLPAKYRNYLAVMGHKSGRLLTHDHYAATYEHVICMTAQYREDCDAFPEEPHVHLPPDALIIVGRLGEQFLMICCGNSDDSAVWYFNEYDPDLRKSYDSVLDWLYAMADDARDAIDRGYYDMCPNGTRP